GIPRWRWSTLWTACRSKTTRPSTWRSTRLRLEAVQALPDGGDLALEPIERRLQAGEGLAEEHRRLVGRLEVVDHPTAQLAHGEEKLLRYRGQVARQRGERVGLAGQFGQHPLLELPVDPPV